MDFTESVFGLLTTTPTDLNHLPVVSADLFSPVWPFLGPVGGSEASFIKPVETPLNIYPTKLGSWETSGNVNTGSQLFSGGFDSLTGYSLQKNQAGEIVFIDPGVENYQSLLAGVARNAEVVILDSTGNELNQITEILSQRHNVSGVHIVSHGSAGALNFADGQVNIADISQAQSWKKSLTADADIILYGCDVAAGDDGKAFVKELSDLTGADVAASTDKTGFGGNWDFEYKTGNIETGLIFSEPVINAYQNSLATFNIADGDVTSLISAITTANTNNQADIINLAAGGTYTLTAANNGVNGLPIITLDSSVSNSLIINGNGATIQRSTAVGTPSFRFFQVNGGGVASLVGLTLKNGNPGATGGAILSNSLSGLTVTNSSLINNTGTNGGAIAINSGATAEIINSTFSGNTATGSGGAIFTNTTVNVGPTVNITNNTIVYNTAVTGGGIFRTAATTSGSVNVKNSIIAGNTATTNADVSGIFVTQGNNLIGVTGTSTGFAASEVLAVNLNTVISSTLTTTNPTLPLAYQSLVPTITPTPYYALITTNPTANPAIDGGGTPTGDISEQITQIDQRGLPRVFRSYDIGAVESEIDRTNDAPVVVLPSGTYSLYNGTGLPAAGGQGLNYFGLSSDPTTGVDATQTAGASFTTLNTTPEYDDYAGYFSNPIYMPVLDRTAGYTVEFTARITSEDHAGTNADKDGDGVADRAGFSIIALSSDKLGVELGFWTDSIWAQNSGTAEPPSGTLFTHGEASSLTAAQITSFTSALTNYTLAIQGNTYTLSATNAANPTPTVLLTGSVKDYSNFSGISNPLIPSQYTSLLNPYNTPNFLFFGDNTPTSRANFDLGQVQVTTTTSVVTNEDTSVVIPNVSVRDIDAGQNNITVTLSVGNGTLTVNSAVTNGVTAAEISGNNTATVTLTSSQDKIYTTLSNATGLSYLPALNFNGTDTLTVSANDNGFSVGSAQIGTRNIPITVNAVNDAPVNSLPAVASTNEDTALVFSGANLISISDVDAGSNNVQVSLASTNGVLKLSTQTGITINTGADNSSAMTLTGTIASINTALNGMSFTPTANYNGAASITINTSDLGNTGTGGVLTDSDSITVNVGAVNDAPTLSLPASQSVNQNTNLSISGISVSDIDASTGNLQVTLSVSNGLLTLNSLTGLAFTIGDGTADSSMTFTGSLTNINAALLNLTYVSSGNFFGSDLINFDVSDLGNTGGGALTASGSITVNVAGVPYAASSVVINEVVTNPQQDWSTTNFNGVVSAGAVTDGTDEWVELYINQAGLNLTGWTIELNDTTPVTGSLAAGGAFVTSRYINSGGGSFTNTAVGDYLILGNVNGGAMNNNITLALKDHTGTTIDQITFTNGAATGVTDEAVARVPNGSDTNNDTLDLRKQTATLGTSNNIGQLVLGEHITGQITDQFTTTQTSNVLHRFNLTASNENINVGSLTFSVSPTGILNADISGLQLVRDVNNNGIQDGGDVVVGTVESPINLADGLTFSNLTVPVGSNNYLLVANVNNLAVGDRLSLGLTNAGIINNVGATSGLQIADTGTVTSTVHTVDVSALSVVINEVAWMGTQANATDEWIELFNPTTNAIDLTGWTIQSGTGTTITITNGVIAAGGYFLLERTADTTVNSIPANFIYTGGLNNTTGTTLTLRSSEGTIIDSANGNGGAWPAGSNAAANARFTMERIDPTSPDIDSNWKNNNGITRNGTDATGNNILGTPSAQNSAYATPGVVITELGGSTVLTEGGVTDTYTVVLNTPVTAPITVNLTNVGGQTTTNVTTLTFDNTNWNVAQTVTVTAVDDTTAEGTHTGTIQHTVTSSDVRYNGIAVSSVNASITDNDSNPPVINLTPGSLSYTENNGVVVIDDAASVSDSDSADFNGGVLTVQFAGGTGLAEDSLSIQNVGNAAGQIGVTGSTISYGGVGIGTFSGGNNGSTPLVVNLNANANVTAVSALLKNIVYLNNSENPSSLSRTVQFQMTDGDNGVGLAVTKTINVVPVNDAPTISAITAQSTNEDTATAAISFTIGDIETLPDSLNLTATSSDTTLIPSSNIVFAGTGNNRTVTLTPAANQNGIATITINVNDGTTSSSTNFVLTVNGVNDAPTFTSTPIVAGNQDSTYTYSIVASDVDAGDTLTITSASSLPSWLTLTDNGNGTATLTGTPTNANVGTQNISLVVTDAAGVTATQNFTINIANVNDAPVFSSTPITTGTQDSAYSYTITTTDPDTSDTRSITASSLPSWLTLTDNGNGTATLTGTPTNSNVGSNSISLVVTDAAGVTATQNFTINIANVNDAPVFSSTPITTGNQNSPYSYTITTTDPDTGDTRSISATTLPAWLTLTDNGNGTATLTGTPTNANVGNNNIALLVTDATGATATQNFTLNITSFNNPPIFTSLPSNTATENQPYLYNITTTDLDGNAVTLSAVNLPAWLTLTDNGNGTGTLSGTPNQTQAGTYNIVLQVSDGITQTQQTFTLNSDAVNDTPILATNNGITLNENATKTITSADLNTTDSDNSSADIVYTLTQLPQNGVIYKNNIPLCKTYPNLPKSS